MVTGFAEIMKDRDEVPPGVDMIVGKPVTQREICRALASVVAAKPAARPRG